MERGKIVEAEFTYDGKVAPSFPKSFIDGTKLSTLAWYLKERILAVPLLVFGLHLTIIQAATGSQIC